MAIIARDLPGIASDAPTPLRTLPKPRTAAGATFCPACFWSTPDNYLEPGVTIPRGTRTIATCHEHRTYAHPPLFRGAAIMEYSYNCAFCIDHATFTALSDRRFADSSARTAGWRRFSFGWVCPWCAKKHARRLAKLPVLV